MKITLRAPDSFRIETEIRGYPVLHVGAGGRGWSLDPLDEVYRVTSMPDWEVANLP
jgi:hypothetical protein